MGILDKETLNKKTFDKGIFDKDFVTLEHGSGGLLYRQLIEDVFLPAFANPALNELGDASVVEAEGKRLAMTTDSFVVQPLFFPGGDIGRLAVCGTVNDLAVSGAKPAYLSTGMIIESGFPIKELKKIVHSMAQAAKEAGVKIVTGDTKVVAHGYCDGIYINTAGIGFLPELHVKRQIQPGDCIVINGSIGDHGMAVMAAREGLSGVTSDVAPLSGIILCLSQCVQPLVMRDPTRGGVAATLNEWAEKYQVGIKLDESRLPISNETGTLCDLLGIDPLCVANEGKFLAVISAGEAERALSAMKEHPLGKNSAIIGVVSEEYPKRVYLQTLYGGLRLIDMPSGELLPRIC